jgi:uncharacterized membrane protein required for colicin V production
MTWFDLVVILIVAAFGTVEAKRGAAPAVLDCAALVLAGQIANGAHRALANSLGAAPWIGFTVLYVLLGVGGILLARFIHNMTMWSLDTFDPLIGSAFGIASGVAVAHAFAQIVLVNAGPEYPALAQSVLGDEVLNFTTYRRVVAALTHLGE